MKIELPWIVDPGQKVESVSLTFCVVFGVAALTLNILKSVGKVAETAGIDELFWGSLALYFGRRNINIGGKSYNANKVEEIEKKVVNE